MPTENSAGGRSSGRSARRGEALRLKRQSYSAHVACYGAAAPETIMAASNLSNSLLHNELFPEAVAFARENYDVALRTLGENHYYTFLITTALGAILFKDPDKSAGNVVESEALFARALKTARRILGVEIKCLAATPRVCRVDAALRLSGRARTGIFGPEHPKTRTAASNHAEATSALAVVQRLAAQRGLPFPPPG